MELHPCACGATEAPAQHAVRAEGAALRSVWSGGCARCGKPRSFEFVLLDGDGPSEIIGAAEFLRISDAAARRVPAGAGRSPQAARDLRRAVACLREVLKFFAAGAPVIEGVSVSRERLQARLAAYEELLAGA